MTTKPAFEEYEELETGGPIGEEQVQDDPPNRPRPGGLPDGDGRPRKLPPGEEPPGEEIAKAVADDQVRRRGSDHDIEVDYRALSKKEG